MSRAICPPFSIRSRKIKQFLRSSAAKTHTHNGDHTIFFSLLFFPFTTSWGERPPHRPLQQPPPARTQGGHDATFHTRHTQPRREFTGQQTPFCVVAAQNKSTQTKIPHDILPLSLRSRYSAAWSSASMLMTTTVMAVVLLLLLGKTESIQPVS